MFVHLNGQSELIAERMARREGHFMKQQMLLSQVRTPPPPLALSLANKPRTGHGQLHPPPQLAALEPLQEDERGVVIDDISAPPDQIAADILRRVGELTSS